MAKPKQESHSLIKGIVDSALAISAVSGVAYVAAYQYESGFLAYFGAGQSTVRIGSENSITIFVIMLLSIAVVAIVLKMLLDHLSRESSLKNFIVLLLTCEVLFVTTQLTLAYVDNSAHFQINDFILAQIISIAMAGMLNWSLKTSDNKVANNRRAIGSSLLWQGFMVIVTVFILSTRLAIATGYVRASNERYFKLVAQEDKTYLIIREYGDRAVLQLYNQKSNTLSNTFRYAALDDEIKYETIKTHPVVDHLNKGVKGYGL